MDEKTKSYFIVRAGKYNYFRNDRHKTIVKDANVVSELPNGYKVKFTLEGQSEEFSGNMYLDGKSSFNAYDDVLTTNFIRDQVISILNEKGYTHNN